MPNVGVLWDDEVVEGGPFRQEKLDEAYRLFSEIARESGIDVFVARFGWYSGGVLEKAYRFHGGDWELVEDIELDGVFDKYRFDEETRKLKEQVSESLPVVNDYQLEALCKDKLLTYQRFPGLVPETRIATQDDFEEILEEYGVAVFKPRFSFGGQGVEIIESSEEFDEPDEPEEFIVQGFVDSGHGVPGIDVNGVHDIRVIVVTGEVISCFIRTPSEGYISNVSRGGSIRRVDQERLPREVIETAVEVDQELEDFGPRVYGLDVMVDGEGGAHLIELNSKPGLTFYGDSELRKGKRPVMEKIVEIFESRV